MNYNSAITTLGTYDYGNPNEERGSHINKMSDTGWFFVGLGIIILGIALLILGGNCLCYACGCTTTLPSCLQGCSCIEDCSVGCDGVYCGSCGCGFNGCGCGSCDCSGYGCDSCRPETTTYTEYTQADIEAYAFSYVTGKNEKIGSYSASQKTVITYIGKRLSSKDTHDWTVYTDITGYTFEGFYDSLEFKRKVDISKFKADETYYAKYTENRAGEAIRVEVRTNITNAQTGEQMVFDSFTFRLGYLVNAIPNVNTNIEGYEFIGIYANGDQAKMVFDANLNITTNYREAHLTNAWGDVNYLVALYTKK